MAYARLYCSECEPEVDKSDISPAPWPLANPTSRLPLAMPTYLQSSIQANAARSPRMADIVLGGMLVVVIIALVHKTRGLRLNFESRQASIEIVAADPSPLFPESLVDFSMQRLVSPAAVERALESIGSRTGLQTTTGADALAYDLDCKTSSEKQAGTGVVLSYRGDEALGATLIEELARRFVTLDVTRLVDALSRSEAVRRREIQLLESRHPQLAFEVDRLTEKVSDLQKAIRADRIEMSQIRLANLPSQKSFTLATTKRLKLGSQLTSALVQQNKALMQLQLDQKSLEELRTEVPGLSSLGKEISTASFQIHRIKRHYFLYAFLIAEIAAVIVLIRIAKRTELKLPALCETELGNVEANSTKQAQQVLGISVLGIAAQQGEC